MGCRNTVAIKMPETIKKYFIKIVKSQNITNFCFVRRRDQRLRGERAEQLPKKVSSNLSRNNFNTKIEYYNLFYRHLWLNDEDNYFGNYFLNAWLKYWWQKSKLIWCSQLIEIYFRDEKKFLCLFCTFWRRHAWPACLRAAAQEKGTNFDRIDLHLEVK